MNSDENEKTSIYGGAESDKTSISGENNSDSNQRTEIYGNTHQETSLYTELATPIFKSKTHGIGIEDSIILKEKTFSVIGIISEGTGEAVIYKIEDSNKNTYALKLYFEFANLKEEPNLETLKRIKEINNPDILKLHDFGVGTDKYQGKYCFEISDFAKGGDLFSVTNFKEKYTSEFIENHVVREIFLGIRKLHENKIFHCDLKPQNVFFIDSNQTDLVIGDYGSAKANDLDLLKEIRKSSTVKGTDAYLPPEQVRGIISEKNDYYSFGIILLHLLYPEEFTADNNIKVVDKLKFERIIERQYNSQPIINYNPQYKRLNNLIEGLTLVNHINRFGKEEVEKWLTGEELEVKYKATETSLVQHVKLGYATIKTEKDLIQTIETRDTWWEDIFEDVDTYFAIKAWLGSYHDITSRKVFDEMIQFYKPLGKEYVKEATIRYFEPERSVQIDMNIFNFFTTENIKEEVEKYIRKIDEIWKFTSLENIRFYLFQLEFSLRQLQINTNNQEVIVAQALIEKIFSVFGLIPNDFSDFKTQLQDKIQQSSAKEISKTEYATLHKNNNLQEASNSLLVRRKTNIENISFELLVRLFYAFNSKRTFKNHEDKQYTELEHVGYFFAVDQTLFDNEYNQVELKVFLDKKELSKLYNNRCVTFLFNIFNSEIRSSIFMQNILFTHRKAIIYYSIDKSLIDFFANKGINSSVIEKGEDVNIELITPIRPKSNQLNNEFLTSIYKKHRITEDNCELSSLQIIKSKINNFTSSYRKSCSKKAKVFTWGIFIYLIPAIIALISSIIVIYPPDLILDNMDQSNYAISTGVLNGILYLIILISLIPSSLFCIINKKKTNLNLTFGDDSYSDIDFLDNDFLHIIISTGRIVFRKRDFRYPHYLIYDILLWLIFTIFFIGFLLTIILWIILGIGSFFGNYQTDSALESLMTFIFLLSFFPVTIASFRPIISFFKRTLKESKIILSYIFNQVIKVFVILGVISYLGFTHTQLNQLSWGSYRASTIDMQQINEIANQYIIIVDVANIRTGPSTNHNVIAQASKGDIVTAIDFSNNTTWYKIEFNNQIGYINTSLISKK